MDFMTQSLAVYLKEVDMASGISPPGLMVHRTCERNESYWCRVNKNVSYDVFGKGMPMLQASGSAQGRTPWRMSQRQVRTCCINLKLCTLVPQLSQTASSGLTCRHHRLGLGLGLCLVRFGFESVHSSGSVEGRRLQ